MTEIPAIQDLVAANQAPGDPNDVLFDAEQEVEQVETIEEELPLEQPLKPWVPFADRDEFKPVLVPGTGAFAGPMVPQIGPTTVTPPDTADERLAEVQNVLRGVLSGQYGRDADAYDNVVNQHGGQMAAEVFGDDEFASYGDTGYEFNLSGPIQSGSWLAPIGPTINGMAGHTRNTNMAAYWAMDDAERARLDQMLWLAGYGEPGAPIAGTDHQLAAARYTDFLSDQVENMGIPTDVRVNNRIHDRFQTVRQPTVGTDEFANRLAGNGGGGPTVVRASDPETIKDTIRSTIGATTGLKADENVVAALAAEASGKEVARLTSFANAQAAFAENIEDQVDAAESSIFYDALQRTIGGEFHIADSQWADLALMTTGDARLEKTPENERDVMGRFVGSVLGANGGLWEPTIGLVHTFFGGENGQGWIPADGWRVNQQEPDRVAQLLNPERFTTLMMQNMVAAEEEWWDQASSSAGGGVEVQYDYNVQADAARMAKAATRAERQTWQYHERAQQFFDKMTRASTI